MTALLFPPFDRSRPAPRPPDEPATESSSRLHPVAGVIDAAVLATVAATNPLGRVFDQASVRTVSAPAAPKAVA